MSEHETDVMELLQRMQVQMTFLEKKLDTLIQQSRPRTFDRPERTFSKPFRPYGRPQRPDGRPPSHHPQSHGQGNFAPKKKPYFGPKNNHS